MSYNEAYYGASRPKQPPKEAPKGPKNVPKPDPEGFSQYIRDYYQQEYIQMLDLEKSKMKDFVLESQEFGNWGAKNRNVINGQIFKYLYALNKTQVITTCFKVTRKLTSCIYGYLHSECSQQNINEPFEHKIVCTGPTFVSKDGEYRGRLIPWMQFRKLMEKFLDIFTDVEQLIIDRMLDREMTFQADFYYPKCFNEKNHKLFEQYINNTRLPIKFFILSWFYDNLLNHTKDMYNHINPGYDWIFNKDDDKALIYTILKKIGVQTGENIINSIFSFTTNVGEKHNMALQPLSVGQKLLVVTENELKTPDDINFDTWREIYISNRASAMVVNLISPTFPILGNWFFIQRTQAGIYDNFAMHERYDHSKVAVEILDELKAADDHSYVYDEHGDIIPVGNKFLKVSKEIRNNIAFMSSELVISNVTLCMLTEYVGRTIYDLPKILTYSNHFLGFDKVFTEKHVFIKHIFEFMYAFYTLNTSGGIVHGDPHMNNVTFRMLYNMEDKKIDSPHVAYVVKDKTYIFPHSGYFSTVIDFSRSLLGDKIALRKEFGKPYTKQFLANQRPRTIATINKYMPIIVSKHGAELDTALTLNYPLVFKAMSSIDTYVFVTSFITFLNAEPVFNATAEHVNPKIDYESVEPHPPIKLYIDPAARALLKRIATRAEQMTMDNIMDVIEKRITHIDQFEWPNLTLIDEFFPEYLFESVDQYSHRPTIVDIFNSNYPMKYDPASSEEWGPLISAEFEAASRSKFNMEPDHDFNEWLRHKNFDEADALTDLANKYVDDKNYPVIIDPDWAFM